LNAIYACGGSAVSNAGRTAHKSPATPIGVQLAGTGVPGRAGYRKRWAARSNALRGHRGPRGQRADMAKCVFVVIGLVLASLQPVLVDAKIYRNYSDVGELTKNHASLSLSDILPTQQKTYDKNRAPKLLGQPTVVYFHVTVLSIDSINEESMTYVADIFLAQSWRDPRLRLPENMSEEYRILDVDWLHSIWRPDCFFKNAKKVTFHEMSIPNHYLWLYHDKTLLYMSKLTLVLSCAMKFESYPHDTQICSMMIESREYQGLSDTGDGGPNNHLPVLQPMVEVRIGIHTAMPSMAK
uniref:Neurotransmitter-gated ion-channel ligand-binding domain-containing protein n=2 Tax=Anopheles atroparvus TaxID=41427 RepID=A0A182JAN8_ANOAO